MSDIKGRLFLVAFLITVFAIALVIRLFSIQVLSSEYYQSLAERQQLASRELAPRRGEIFLKDKNGRFVTVATTRTGYLLFVDPRKIEDAGETFERLSKALGAYSIAIDRDTFFLAVSKKDDPFEELLPRIEKEVADAVISEHIPGVGATLQEWRFYPLGALAAHVIGFFGFGEDGKEAGQYGIERFFEDDLNGNRGFVNGVKSSGGVLLNFGKRLFAAPSEGKDIELTLELGAQQQLEGALDTVWKKFSPEIAGGIVINPHTGKILAMASRDAFDPNRYAETENISYFVNPLVSSIFELGSVFKPLTIAGALDSGAVTPETTYFDKGFVQIGPARISNYDGRGRGMTTVQGVLSESLNTGAIFVEQKLGKEKFLHYVEHFGLAEKTDIELPAEGLGNISNLESGRDIEYASASFGQGIAVTPIAFVRAVSALANGGVLIQPYIVERTRPVDKGGLPRVISETAAETITQMLVQVVDKAFLGGGKGLPHYSVAAKTGTAQIPNKNAPGYSEKFLHSIFGYAPAYDPEFLIFLFAKNPRGVTYSSQSLGQAFLDLTKALLYYYEVPPDR